MDVRLNTALCEKLKSESVPENTMRNQMRSSRSHAKFVFFLSLVPCLIAVTGCRSQKPNAPNPAPGTGEPAQQSSSAAPTFQQQRQNAEKQLRPQIETQRQQNQKEAEQTLNQDAIAAVQQTEKAIQAISQNKRDDALAAIEQATGKISILLARNPTSALIPVDVQVVAIEAAPEDIKAIDQRIQQATDAMKQKDLPVARLLLASLVSELRIQTTNLPLATYPGALQQAARLLDQGKNQDAGKVLLTALNTLTFVDHIIPLPLILAQAAIDQANAQRQNKDVAQTLLQTARNELNRSKHLGYMTDDSEYKALDDEISNLQKQIKGPSDTTALFSHLRDRIAAFIKRQKEHVHH
jgi:hypothetical protein